MLKTFDTVRDEIEYSIKFTLADKPAFDENDFLEFHRNMYWVQPKEQISNFLNVKLILFYFFLLFRLLMNYGIIEFEIEQ